MTLDLQTLVTLINSKGEFLHIHVNTIDVDTAYLAATAARDAINLNRPNPKYGEWFIQELAQVLKDDHKDDHKDCDYCPDKQ